MLLAFSFVNDDLSRYRICCLDLLKYAFPGSKINLK